MNRNQQSVMAGLLALALAGCGSTKPGGDEMAAGATASGAGTSSTSQAATPATSGAAATAATEMPMATQPQTPATQGPSTMPGMLPNAVVVSIETVPRQGATGAVGGSGGTTSSSMGQDKQYRVTLRMDDGATRVVTQDKPPAFRNGDRVNMLDGVITR